jgi:hypothetical protein
MFAQLAHAIVRKSPAEFNSQDLANVVWAFATVGILTKEVFKLVADGIAARPSMADFKAQELTNVTWAFAKLGQ